MSSLALQAHLSRHKLDTRSSTGLRSFSSHLTTPHADNSARSLARASNRSGALGSVSSFHRTLAPGQGGRGGRRVSPHSSTRASRAAAGDAVAVRSAPPTDDPCTGKSVSRPGPAKSVTRPVLNGQRAKRVIAGDFMEQALRPDGVPSPSPREITRQAARAASPVNNDSGTHRINRLCDSISVVITSHDGSPNTRLLLPKKDASTALVKQSKTKETLEKYDETMQRRQETNAQLVEAVDRCLPG
jgi:hypothetical protein